MVFGFLKNLFNTPPSAPKPQDEHDPAILTPLNYDEDGVIQEPGSPPEEGKQDIAPKEEEESKEFEERRRKKRWHTSYDRRAIPDRRQKKAKGWRTLNIFDRRKGKQDRRYGIDRRLIKDLSLEETEIVKRELHQKIIHKDERKKIEAPKIRKSLSNTLEASAIKSIRNITRFVQADETTPHVEEILKDTIYSGQHAIAEVYSKDLLFDETGNNYVRLLPIEGEEFFIRFNKETKDGVISITRPGEKRSLRLIKSVEEVINIIVGHPVTLIIDKSFQRPIKFISEKEAGAGNDSVKLSDKTRQTYKNITILLDSDDNKLEYVSDNEIHINKVPLYFDNHQVIYIADQYGNNFRLTGLAGKHNLEIYSSGQWGSSVKDEEHVENTPHTVHPPEPIQRDNHTKDANENTPQSQSEGETSSIFDSMSPIESPSILEDDEDK